MKKFQANFFKHKSKGKVLNSIRSIKKRIRKLMQLEQCESGMNGIKIVIRNLLEDNKTIRKDEIKNLKEI